ncbi:MAG: 30S ribosomal protein S6 [Patescibacteria group bacterium]
MGKFELAVLYHPDLEIDLDKGADKVKKIVAECGGKVTDEDVWGKRKLAYKIGENEHAVYVFYTVEMDGESVSKIESNLKITDEVIRFLVTKPDEKAIAKAKLAKSQRKKVDREDSKEESDKK